MLQNIRSIGGDTYTPPDQIYTSLAVAHSLPDITNFYPARLTCKPPVFCVFSALRIIPDMRRNGPQRPSLPCFLPAGLLSYLKRTYSCHWCMSHPLAGGFF